MQIVPFYAHYQSVYTNFDFSSFSRISCIAVGGLKQPDCHIKATRLPCCGTLFSLKSCSISHTLLSPFLYSPVCTTAVTHAYGGRHTRRTTTVAHACHGRRSLNSKGARAQQDVAKEAPDRSKGSTGSERPL